MHTSSGRTVRKPTKSSLKKTKELSTASRQEVLFVKGCVSLVMVVMVFVLTKIDTKSTNDLKIKLKTAITETVSFSEAKEYGQKSIEMIHTFKEKQTDKIDAAMDEKVFLPNDAATAN